MTKKEILTSGGHNDLNPLISGSESCAKGHAFGPAIRAYWLLHYIHSGHGVFVINDKEYKISPGEIFVIPPYKKTYYKADDENPWSYSWIGFTSGIELPEAFKSAVIKCANAENIFYKINQCASLGDGKKAFLCSCIWELISYLLYENTKTTANYAERAKNIIDNEYMNGLKVTDISERLLINRSYLFNVFKNVTGMSPQRYILKVRFEKAIKLITVYNMTVTDAAFSVGYKDVYTFSKIFKKHFGVSPKKYCENLKKTKTAK